VASLNAGITPPAARAIGDLAAPEKEKLAPHETFEGGNGPPRLLCGKFRVSRPKSAKLHVTFLLGGASCSSSCCEAPTCGVWMTVTTGGCEIVTQAQEVISKTRIKQLDGLDVRSGVQFRKNQKALPKGWFLANKDDMLANGSRRLGTSELHFRIRAGSCMRGFSFANFDDSLVLLRWRNLLISQASTEHRLSTWLWKVGTMRTKDGRTQLFDEFLLLQLFYPKSHPKERSFVTNAQRLM
jgi:hypothetical protein